MMCALSDEYIQRGTQSDKEAEMQDSGQRWWVQLHPSEPT